MNGIILIDKPVGWTSFDVVAKIRSLIRAETSNSKTTVSKKRHKTKVGHAGTLDPLATGLLIVLVGDATKKQSEFMKKDKTYEVEMKLGETSTTGDEEGKKTKSSKQRVVNQKELQDVISKFVGKIDQVPPSYSAVKVNGQRAYKLARAGKEVKIEPRKIEIYEITVVDYIYPTVQFTARVSSGTYIRSLVEDIGRTLGVGAYMTTLRRTEIGEFSLKNAISAETLSAQSLARLDNVW